MDLEKIRKINELTKTLQQHNFATSSIDAVENASQVYNYTPKVEENPFQQPSQLGQPFVSQTQTQPQNFTVTPATTPAQEQKPSETPSLLERRYQLILEMSTKRFDQEINGLKDQISSLSSQLFSLRADIMKISSQPKPQYQQEVKNEQTQQTQSLNQQYQQEISQQQNTQSNPTSEPKKEHPRQGKFTSEDVPIEKYFYFGRK